MSVKDQKKWEKKRKKWEIIWRKTSFKLAEWSSSPAVKQLRAELSYNFIAVASLLHGYSANSLSVLEQENFKIGKFN